jgi:hypothetical protein
LGRCANQYTTRLAAVFCGVSPEPRPSATAYAERVNFTQRSLVEATGLPTLAAHDEVRQVAARSALVEPELLPAVVFTTVYKPPPVEIVDVSLRTGTNKASGNNRAVVKPYPFIEPHPVDKTTRSLTLVTAAKLLHDEPLGKPPHANSQWGLTWIIFIGRWRKETGRSNPGHKLKLPRKPWLERVVELTAEAPARLYGLAPRKGHLEVGSDADIVLVDFTAERTLENATVVSRAGWTAYAGRRIRGRPVVTLSRGRVVASDGRAIGGPGGQYLPGPGLSRGPADRALQPSPSRH